ncbi:hypothetical protein [Aquimarina latercula]|uniref:hypothetical protein n=1 Tax=Aquimarina latercula TaxID=987 RepID=UPI000420E495|nr:hypothetical protein [Aquimarina latercula]
MKNIYSHLQIASDKTLIFNTPYLRFLHYSPILSLFFTIIVSWVAYAWCFGLKDISLIFVISSIVLSILTLLTTNLLIVNPIGKKLILKIAFKERKKELLPSKRFFKPWWTTAYFDYKVTLFYNSLITSGLLNKNRNDLDLIDSFIESIKLKINETEKSFVYWSGAITIFPGLVAAIWQLFLKKLTIKDLLSEESIVLYFTLLLFTFSIFMLFSFIRFLIKDYNRYKWKTEREIINKLEVLKQNLAIQYSKSTNINC